MSAFHAHCPAHQLGQLAADRQAKARAAELAGGGGVGLFELLEQLVQSLGRNADAGVRDGQGQPRLAGADRDLDLAGLGELQRVGDQVVEDLPHPGGVPEPGPLGLLLDGQVEGQPLLRRHAAEGRVSAARQVGDVERRLLELQPLSLDGRKIQDVVEDRQQRLAGLADDLQARALFRAERVRLHHLRHSEHAVQGRADLVAHGGQEGALGHVGRLGLVLGPHQRLFGQLAGGDVPQGADQAARPAPFVGQQGHGALGPDLFPVRPLDSVGRKVGRALFNMPPPLFIDARPVAGVYGAGDVGEQLLVGAGFLEEGVLGAGLEQHPATVVHLPDMDVGETEGEIQPLFRALHLFQALDHFSDVVGGDHKTADFAG